MSHFVTIRTELREREALLEALRDLGLAFEEGKDLPVRGDQRREERAEIVVHAAPGADVGFRRTGEAYEAVADWYRLEQQTGMKRPAFLARLSQRYGYHIVLAQAKDQNLIVEEEVLPDGEIILTLSERE